MAQRSADHELRLVEFVEQLMGRDGRQARLILNEPKIERQPQSRDMRVAQQLFIAMQAIGDRRAASANPAVRRRSD